MINLCQRIAQEKDRALFLELVKELNGLLSEENARLLKADQQKPS